MKERYGPCGGKNPNMSTRISSIGIPDLALLSSFFHTFLGFAWEDRYLGEENQAILFTRAIR